MYEDLQLTPPTAARDDFPPASQSISSDSTGQMGERFFFLDWVRAISALLVVYAHNVAGFSIEHGEPLAIVRAVRTYMTGPLGIIQNFGWMGVVMFFFASGFIITHVSLRESRKEFVIKRVFRIFPLLVLIAVISSLKLAMDGLDIELIDVIRNALLINYFSIPQIVFVGVAWTLVVEVLFYALTVITRAIRNIVMMCLVNILLVFVVITICRDFGAEFFLFASSFSYVSVILMGQIAYIGLHRKMIGPTPFIILVLLSFSCFMYGIESMQPQFLDANNSYAISITYGFFAFCLLIKLHPYIRHNRLVFYFSQRSYTIYLVHRVFGLTAASWTVEMLGVANSIMLGLIVTAVASTILFACWENPFNRFGAKLARLARPQKSGT